MQWVPWDQHGHRSQVEFEIEMRSGGLGRVRAWRLRTDDDGVVLEGSRKSGTGSLGLQVGDKRAGMVSDGGV